MFRKLKQKKGETLVECLAAVVVIVFVISMLPTAVVTAAKINAAVRSMKVICAETRDVVSGAASTVSANVKIYGGTIVRDADGNITSAEGTLGDSYQGYLEDEFYYYTK